LRPFEIILLTLLGVGSIQILFGTEKKDQTKLLLKFIFPVFLIHLFLEQYRWQMFPAYGSMLALVFLQKYSIHSIIKFLFFIWMGLSVFLPAAIPIIKMPDLSGPYTIGSTINHWVDESRMEWFTDEDPDDIRQIMVQFWYPAEKVKKAKRTPYVDNINTRIESIGIAGGFPGFLVKHIKLTKTNSYIDLEADSGPAPFPIIIFSHGITSMRYLHTSFAEKLANHGYVVIGLDHSYDANITIFPDGSIADYRSDITGHPDSIIIRKKQINTRASDIRFIIDQLERIQSGEIKHVLNGYLDANRIGVAGHSFGGATSTVVSFLDSRITATLALDSWMNPVPREVIEKGLMQPFLHIGRPHWDDSDYPSNYSLLDALIQNNRGPSHRITIKNTLHMDYCDAPLFSPLVQIILDVGKMNRHRSVYLVNQISLEFFDQYLQNTPSLMLNKKIDVPEFHYN